jgi:hypothetical protein
VVEVRQTGLALLVALIAGCGGGDEQAEEPRPARTTATSSEAIFHTVANDLRDIAALADGGCANEAAIRRAMGRLEEDAAQLPADVPQGRKAQRLVDEALADTRDTLRSCP